MSPLPSRFDENTVLPDEIEGFEDMTFLFDYRGQKTRGLIWMNHDEAAFLWKCVRRARTDLPIVEIGRAEGGSTILMGAARRDQNTQIISIDKSPVDDEQLLTLFEKLKIENVELLQKNSQVFNVAPIGEVGLVFIDADHTYPGVKADFENWLPAVAVGGYVVFHDVTDVDLENFGPIKLYRELLEDLRVRPVDGAGSVQCMMKV